MQKYKRKKYWLRFKVNPHNREERECIRNLVHDRINNSKTFRSQTIKIYNAIRFAVVKMQRDCPDLVKKGVYIFKCRPYGGLSQLMVRGGGCIALKHSCKIAKWCPHCYARHLAEVRKRLLSAQKPAYSVVGLGFKCQHLSWPERRKLLMETRGNMIRTLRGLGETQALIGTMLRYREHEWYIRSLAIIPSEIPCKFLIKHPGWYSWEPVHTPDLTVAMEPLVYLSDVLEQQFVMEELSPFLEYTHNLPETRIWGKWPKV